MVFNKFKNLFCKNKKSIRLAVIGSPSSGKTFLLRDIILALNLIEANGNGYDYNSNNDKPYFEGGAEIYGNLRQLARENIGDIARTPF